MPSLTTPPDAPPPGAQAISAMILAAGRGERMRPLTDTCPKPLLAVRGQPLIAWHTQALANAGFSHLVINTAWLGTQIADYFGDNPYTPQGQPLTLHYSHEGQDFGAALETAGGIARALPMLGDMFWVVAADVFMPDFEFSALAVQNFQNSDKLAHLWLVPNPAHNPDGDFGLSPEGLACNQPPNNSERKLTYSTVGLYRREFFSSLPFGNPQGIKAPLAPLLRTAIDRGAVSAQYYPGAWADVGTPERLQALQTLTPQNTPRAAHPPPEHLHDIPKKVFS